MAEARTWTEASCEHNIVVSQVATATHAGFADTMRAIEIQAGQITVQENEMKTASDEVNRISDEILCILGDCRSFLLDTRHRPTLPRPR